MLILHACAGSWQLVAARSSFRTLSGAVSATKADMANVHRAAEYRQILDREWPQLPDDLQEPIAEQAAVASHSSGPMRIHALPRDAQAALICSNTAHLHTADRAHAHSCL